MLLELHRCGNLESLAQTGSLTGLQSTFQRILAMFPGKSTMLRDTICRSLTHLDDLPLWTSSSETGPHKSGPSQQRPSWPSLMQRGAVPCLNHWQINCSCQVADVPLVDSGSDFVSSLCPMTVASLSISEGNDGILLSASASGKRRWHQFDSSLTQTSKWSSFTRYPCPYPCPSPNPSPWPKSAFHRCFGCI